MRINSEVNKKNAQFLKKTSLFLVFLIFDHKFTITKLNKIDGNNNLLQHYQIPHFTHKLMNC
ncbi:hypothetical protein A6S26_14825 [Nostoc sp. ATCC 43529]|nr:hypothetical protein A6S26_14825 [Nostoc sp. ATCC 43529]